MTKLVTSILVLFVFTASSLVIAQDKDPYPWGPDFEKIDQLVSALSCDANKTLFKTYEGPTIEKQSGYTKYTYTGITISVRGEVLYYIFSPNPDSLSPIMLSFRRENNRELKEISESERNARLKQEAPNLLAEMNGKRSDCKIIALSLIRRGSSPPEKN